MFLFELETQILRFFKSSFQEIFVMLMTSYEKAFFFMKTFYTISRFKLLKLKNG